MKDNHKLNIDIKSFRQYYDLYYEPLSRFLNLYTQDKAIIEDILQEVFMKLWEGRDVIEVDYMKTYLFRAAKNRVLNYLRDEQNRHYLLEKWFEQQLDERSHKDCFNMEVFTEKLSNAVNALPAKCREIFLLSRYEHLSYQQIADKLSISVKTVEAQMGSALKRIKDSFSSSLFILLGILFYLYFIF
ncbi:MAG: RNA polymerase sigma-70 factor [Bacteroides sp.]|nr:RNA polymerase sigma-70 factor [Bacteroides sp.]MCI1683468.1 RNA polymerase sigma-70 factor [Bacteroides sp.]